MIDIDESGLANRPRIEEVAQWAFTNIEDNWKFVHSGRYGEARQRARLAYSRAFATDFGSLIVDRTRTFV